MRGQWVHAMSEFHNPWRQSLENCMTGDNFLRTQEWLDLIEELDDLYRYRCGQHSALNDAYANGRADEREDNLRLLAWAHAKLLHVSWSKQEDALAMDEIKLMLMGAA